MKTAKSFTIAVAITLAVILSHGLVAVIAITLTESHASYEGYKEGSERMIEACYDLIDYSQGHSPSLARN